MAFIEVSQGLNTLLDQWRDAERTGISPIGPLTKITDLLEIEHTAYMQLDPDPFDDKRPGTDSNHSFGHLLKILYDDEEFVNKLLTSYLFNAENNFDLNCCAARQVIKMLSVLSGNEIFQDVETHVGRLFNWAEKEREPLRSYACVLLMVAMQMPECPGMFKEQNAVLVPLVIKRLKYLSQVPNDSTCIDDIPVTEKCLPGGKFTAKLTKIKLEHKDPDLILKSVSCSPNSFITPSRKHKFLHTKGKYSQYYNTPKASFLPHDVVLQQKSILRYLHPMGEYQEWLPVALESNVIELLFHYINVKVQPDPGLACLALLYLSSLLCHKKFIVEFITCGGIQKILEIPLPSPVATISSLCLYYLAYSEDAMERVCLLPQTTIHCLTEYLLWLLECAHVSGRCHSSLFFSMTFSFRAILNLFDSMDGLRKVINMMSTLKILRVDESDLTTDEHVFLDREMAKNACLTLKRYFEVHLAIIASEFKRSAARGGSNPLPTPVPAYKSILNSAITLQDNIEYVMKSGFSSMEKMFCIPAINFNVAPLLLQLVAVASSWKNYNNRVDIMVTALETLSALSASKKVSLTFCQQIDVAPTETQSGIKILLRAVEGVLIPDILVQKAALTCICNCVNSKPWKDRRLLQINNKKSLQDMFSRKDLQDMEVVKKIWLDVRLNNGIKIILSLLHIKSPITEADCVRALACKTLLCLSYDNLICQVLGKLPIFHNEQLNLLMREPVLSDRMNDHEKFCKHASALIERVTGKPLRFEHYESIPNMSCITKADIIAHTKISYPQKELLSIIHNHLISQGLINTAEALKEEANLRLESKPRDPLSSPILHRRISSNFCEKKRSSVSVNDCTTPLKNMKSINLLLSPQPFEKLPNELFQSRKVGMPHTAPNLDSIVTEYLREQHAHCSNPVSTCPPFSLLRPHRCPEPRYREYASVNITKRLMTRERKPRFGGIQGRKHNLRYLYSKFRSTGCIKEPDDDSIFTCCAWFPFLENICLGTQTGDIKIMNYDGQEELLQSCHGAPISTCYISENYKLMTTSAPFGNPLGAVWKLNIADNGTISMDMKFELPEDNFIQFSQSEDWVIGTDDIVAHVYDLGSGQLTRTFFDQQNANHYSKNFACFGPNDDLLLNDGCLWDVRAKRMIHKFDKFNDYVSGIFHPSGLQIIINTEVWDIRTFHLLDTCPALDQCRIIFSNDNEVIYGVKHISNVFDIPIEHNGMLGPYESSFRTFDALDFSPIGTVDVKKTIFDLKPNPSDQILAVIENGGKMFTLDMDSTCRYYEIGRMKRIGEEDSDEDQDDDSEERSNNSHRGLDDVVTLFNNIFENEDYDGIDDEDSWNNDEDDDDEGDGNEEDETEEQEDSDIDLETQDEESDNSDISLVLP